MLILSFENMEIVCSLPPIRVDWLCMFLQKLWGKKKQNNKTTKYTLQNLHFLSYEKYLKTYFFLQATPTAPKSLKFVLFFSLMFCILH